MAIVAFSSSYKIRFIKTVDNWLGSLLARLLPVAGVSAQQADRHIARILFVRPGGLGDALLLLPVIEMFAKEYPVAEIDILAEARNKPALSFLKVPHRVELYTDPGAFFRLRKNHYDVVIDTEQWYRLSTVYARLLKPGRLIGFATNERARLLTDKVNYSLDDYELESFFRLLEPLGIVASQSEKRLEITLEQKTVEKAKRLLGRTDVSQWVAVFPGASLPEKRWSIANYCLLVSELLKKRIGVVVVGGEPEREVSNLIETETGCVSLVGKTSLAETAAVLMNTNLLVSGDSAILHLAASLNVPTVSLFGPSSPVKWSPRGAKHKFLQEQFECVPCSRYGHIPSCPHDVRCLNTLTPENVLVAVLDLLKS
jgi:ADP-heptose:LPS heptosyltransferase